MLFPWPALVTLLNVLLLLWAMWLVGRARARYGVKAPATSGDPGFERVFRMHQNTIEATVMFLPCLWLAAIHWNPRYAGILGVIWLVGRVAYSVGYMRSASARAAGFWIAFLANLVLLFAALFGMFYPLLYVDTPPPPP